MEWFCPVSFDEPETPEKGIEAFKTRVTVLKNKYYSNRGKGHVQDMDDMHPTYDDFHHQ